MPTTKTNHRPTRSIVRSAVTGAGACVIASTLSWAVACRADEVVYVAMRSQIQASRNPVLLGDVADVLTDDDRLRMRLARVDVTDAPGPRDAIEITRKQVELRLLLAGYQADEFRIVGATETEVRNQGQLSGDDIPTRDPLAALPGSTQQVVSSLEDRIMHELKLQLTELWQQPPDRLEVSLLRPLPESGLNSTRIDRIDVVVPAFQKPGNVRPRVSLLADGKLLDVWNISAEALVIRDVVVVHKAIERGQVLSSTDLGVVRRPLKTAGQNATMDQAVGKTGAALSPGDVLHSYDLVEPRQGSQSLIKPRDAVRLVARKGRLTVVVTDAVALQAGNPGDLIRIRNPRSNRVVLGRVEESGEVRVSL